VIRPVNLLTAEMKKFKPFVNAGYGEAGVADLEFRRQNEIHELYDGIRSMQIKIVNYLNDMDALQKDKERAKEDIKDRDEKIGQISREAYRDTLTGVGNKAAYIRKVDELNMEFAAKKAGRSGIMDLAIVMVDLNDLKRVNDDFGHNRGDQYINGCCRMICEIFAHSPVFRIGGDEFVVILQGDDYKHRHAGVAQLKKYFASSSCDETANAWERYSAAVGMAEMTPDEKNIELVFRLADKAMYEDKEQYKKVHGSYR
jgi:diguanylate cyclase (GGDEF)-like protein